MVVMGSFLQRIAAAEGYFSQMPRYYGAQIRGGGSAVKLGINAESLSLPRDTLDIIVCFNWEKYLEVRQELHLGPETLILYENNLPNTIDIPTKAFLIDFTEQSQQVTGSPRDKNIVALGLLLDIIGFTQDRVRDIVETDKELHLLINNWSALTAGIELNSKYTFTNHCLAPPKDRTAKTILHGSTAMSKAAISAGCKAYFGYPITPAAEIMQVMQKELPNVSGVFLQTEDEISSVSMLVGASLTGAKPMTGTSGPGLDLMTEMLGLAVAAEIPLVIANVQRCGPSTGIPSKSEQSDLNHAIYGGHGDAPRVVLAPYNVEGCYHLTIEGFNIAEHFQVPVILLSDQWLGQTFVAVNGDFLEQKHTLNNRKQPVNDQIDIYQRYQPSDDLVSPMSSIGDIGFKYRTSGLSHSNDGSPAFDAETHQALHEKRWKKLLPLCQRDDLVTIFGNETAKKGIITWGSSAQIIRDTINHLGLENVIKVCVPELIYPLPDKVVAFSQSIQQLLVVEMNYSGQLFRFLRSQIDLPKETEFYCRAGGRPFSRRELTQPVQKLAG